jgi:hypothetical protein
MSLAVVIKGPEGLVLAADSRVTLLGKRGNQAFAVNYDNATKLLTFEGQTHIAAVTYGAAVIGARTAHSFIPEFEVRENLKQRLNVEEFCRELRSFFKERWDSAVTGAGPYVGPEMTFVVAGYDEGDAYGKVFVFGVPRTEIQPRNADNFGMTWGGQLELASRMIHGFDPALPGIIERILGLTENEQKVKLQEALKQLEFPIPYQVLPLQDSINLAISMLRSTITFQSLGAGVRSVGGPLEVAVVTRVKGVQYIQKKELRGEQGV